VHDRLHLQRLGRVLRHHPVVAALSAAADGRDLHLVGGVLRDRLLGLPSRDFDAVVAGEGAAVAARAAQALSATLVPLGGKAFAAYRVVGAIAGDTFVLDLWDRAGTSLVADLARRDFTVNSFAVALGAGDDGAVVDPFGGVADLERRLLRATSEESFRGDPLRVLRLPRLLGQLPGFAAEPATLGLARASAAGLTEVAAERVREELVLIFKGADAHRALALLAALDVYPGLWLGAPGRPGPTGGAVLELESLAASTAELHRLAPQAAGAADLLAARLAAAFAHLPEPAASAARFHAAGYLTRRVADRVLRLLATPAIPDGEPAQRDFLHRLGELWPTAVVRLGAAAFASGAGERWRRRAAALAALVAADGAAILDPPRLLDGEEVQHLLGVPAGERVGAALAAVRRAQVAGTVRTREEAVALLARGGGRRGETARGD
jgi:tRNA nucleotidyltransferase/poly(A) polymerase